MEDRCQRRARIGVENLGGLIQRLRQDGAGALGATDKTDYVKFMRVAFRSSLRADFTTGNLGFRCAADDDGGQK